MQFFDEQFLPAQCSTVASNISKTQFSRVFFAHSSVLSPFDRNAERAILYLLMKIQIFFNNDTHRRMNSILWTWKKGNVILCARCVRRWRLTSTVSLKRSKQLPEYFFYNFFLTERTFGPLRFGLIQNDCSITKTKVSIPWDCTEVQFSYSNLLDILFEMYVTFHSFVRFIASSVTLFAWSSFWALSVCECSDMIQLEISNNCLWYDVVWMKSYICRKITPSINVAVKAEIGVSFQQLNRLSLDRFIVHRSKWCVQSVKMLKAKHF